MNRCQAESTIHTSDQSTPPNPIRAADSTEAKSNQYHISFGSREAKSARLKTVRIRISPPKQVTISPTKQHSLNQRNLGILNLTRPTRRLCRPLIKHQPRIIHSPPQLLHHPHIPQIHIHSLAQIGSQYPQHGIYHQRSQQIAVLITLLSGVVSRGGYGKSLWHQLKD